MSRFSKYLLIVLAINALILLAFFLTQNWGSSPYDMLGFIVVAGFLIVIEFITGWILQGFGENTRTFGKALLLNTAILFVAGLFICSAAG